jgi:hypothetical protein
MGRKKIEVMDSYDYEFEEGGEVNKLKVSYKLNIKCKNKNSI